MNDNTINAQQKIVTAIDADELRDQELDQVQGGAGGYERWMPLKSVNVESSGSSKRLFTMDASTTDFWSAEFITD